MKFSTVFFSGLFVIGLTSCGSKQNSVQGFAYEEDYKAQIEIYQDSVNPQIFYQTDRKQVFVPEGTVFNIKKSDTK